MRIITFLLSITLIYSFVGYDQDDTKTVTYSDNSQYNLYQVLREGRKEETEAYYYNTGEEGTKVFIIGGTHGNERAGFLAAEKLLEFFPEKGEVIIIPKANKQAVEINSRTSDNKIDLNRSYPGNPEGNDIEKLAYEIFSVIKEFEPDVIIDLHESMDFHTEGRLGNSIIFGKEGEDLLKVLELIEYINEVDKDLVEFTFFGSPPKNSLNESVSNILEIPVYTVETTRTNEIDKRVSQQLLIAKKIIKIYQ
jgi:predicted deacylase